jgi:hypothetical protein
MRIDMCSKTKIDVLAVENLGEAPAGADGVISCEIIPYAELDDDTLEVLYEQSPEFVMEKRPDWIKEHYPNHVN